MSVQDDLDELSNDALLAMRAQIDKVPEARACVKRPRDSSSAEASSVSRRSAASSSSLDSDLTSSSNAMIVPTPDDIDRACPKQMPGKMPRQDSFGAPPPSLQPRGPAPRSRLGASMHVADGK